MICNYWSALVNVSESCSGSEDWLFQISKTIQSFILDNLTFNGGQSAVSL